MIKTIEKEASHLSLQVSGKLENTGRVVRLVLDEFTSGSTGGAGSTGNAVIHVNVSGGPLSYQYRVTEIVLHFGSMNNLGSEHTINGLFYPAEVYIKCFHFHVYL
jgi:Eukaryotic-type carbonic anhydrase